MSEHGRSLPGGAWVALEEAFAAWQAGGLPCGSAIVDSSGAVIARGRNRAYDAATGVDALERTPLAHAELNALAMIPTDRRLGDDTLWSTQQPCSMCAAAIAFCGVGAVRFLGADPAFVATDDVRAGVVSDPTRQHPELTEWSLFANALFLQPTLRNDHDGVDRNRAAEPETVAIAEAMSAEPQSESLATLVDALWPRLHALADQRRARVARTVTTR